MINVHLPAISIFMDFAQAQTIVPIAKRSSDPSIVARLPKMSARRPDNGRTEAQARVYAAETHAKDVVPRRS